MNIYMDHLFGHSLEALILVLNKILKEITWALWQWPVYISSVLTTWWPAYKYILKVEVKINIIGVTLNSDIEEYIE